MITVRPIYLIFSALVLVGPLALGFYADAAPAPLREECQPDPSNTGGLASELFIDCLDCNPTSSINTRCFDNCNPGLVVVTNPDCLPDPLRCQPPSIAGCEPSTTPPCDPTTDLGPCGVPPPPAACATPAPTAAFVVGCLDGAGLITPLPAAAAAALRCLGNPAHDNANAVCSTQQRVAACDTATQDNCLPREQRVVSQGLIFRVCPDRAREAPTAGTAREMRCGGDIDEDGFEDVHEVQLLRNPFDNTSDQLADWPDDCAEGQQPAPGALCWPPAEVPDAPAAPEACEDGAEPTPEEPCVPSAPGAPSVPEPCEDDAEPTPEEPCVPAAPGAPEPCAEGSLPTADEPCVPSCDPQADPASCEALVCAALAALNLGCPSVPEDPSTLAEPCDEAGFRLEDPCLPLPDVGIPTSSSAPSIPSRPGGP